MVYKRSEAQIMERIRAALAIAENPASTEAEREAALRSANGMMTKHAIDQAMLDAARTVGERRVPTQVVFEMYESGSGVSEWNAYFRTIMHELARTNRCRCIIRFGHKSNVTIVGMQEDVDWVQLLWMQIFLEFVSRVNPKWDNDRSEGANIMALKEAGFKWAEIWNMCKAANGGQMRGNPDSYNPQRCRWMIVEYKKEQQRTGREHVGTQRFEAYRTSFVAAFADRVNARLEQQREDEKEQTEATPGSALALTDVRDRVDEEFYRLFPSARPMTDEELLAYKRRVDEEARLAAKKDAEFLASLSDKERKKVLDEREREKVRRAKDNDRYWRDQQRMQEKLYDHAGWAAGRTAADGVNLSRTKAADSGARTALEG